MISGWKVEIHNFLSQDAEICNLRFQPEILSVLSCQAFLLRLLLGSDLVREFQLRRNRFAKRCLWFFGDQLDITIELEPSPRRNEASHNDVFLQTAQIIDFPADRGFGEHTRGFLERSGRNK